MSIRVNGGSDRDGRRKLTPQEREIQRRARLAALEREAALRASGQLPALKKGCGECQRKRGQNA
jgi:hypothetical protein